MSALVTYMVATMHPLAILGLGFVIGVVSANFVALLLDALRARSEREVSIEVGVGAGNYAGCPECCSSFEGVMPGDPCPSCGIPLLADREAYEAFLRGQGV